MADDAFGDLGAKVSYLVVKSGIPVFASGGENLGTVVKALAAPEADLFDGVVFDTTPHKPGGHKFVDAPEVDALYERGIVLNIDAAEAAKLTQPGKNPGSITVSADDVAGEPGPSFMQRAWNRLSGKD
jgi:hypothetical protein